MAISKKQEKELDKLWADKIKEKGRCEKCGKNKYLNAHHIYSRSRRSVRWDLNNGVCLCSGHHTLTNDSAHKAPADFIDWIKEKRGEEWFDALRIRANTPMKHDYDDIKNNLK